MSGSTRLRRTAAAVSVAAAGLVGLAPTPSSAAPTAMSPAIPIKHVVVIYQENHSFDETLGAYCTRPAHRCNGRIGTVRLADGTAVAMRRSPDIVPQVDHHVAAQTSAVDGGHMDGWATLQGCEAPTYNCLTYYEPGQIPNLAKLAQNFALSDRTFSMSDSPSWGGHLYAAAATLDGFTGDIPTLAPGGTELAGWGCDSRKVTEWTDPATGSLKQVPSCVPAADHSGPFEPSPVPHVTTIFDRLSAAGLSWRIYGALKPAQASFATDNNYGWSICPSFADCLYTKQLANLVPSTRILTAAKSGALPAYSVVTPSPSSAAVVGSHTSQHNNHSMLAGDNWIGKVVSAIENGPQWKSTAIFITYDDCGCFYDHVPPPANPDGTPEGIRVPMVIVSPYAKAGAVDSTNATFASILAFTEHAYGLRPMSANDRNAYDYRNAFDFTQAPRPGVDLHSVPLSPATLRYLRTHPHEDDDPT